MKKRAKIAQNFRRLAGSLAATGFKKPAGQENCGGGARWRRSTWGVYSLTSFSHLLAPVCLADEGFIKSDW